MEFITAEQFLKEDKEVQEVFVDWWKPSEFDVYSIKEDLSSHRVCKSDIEDYKNDELYNIKSGYCIPLLTEGQLRQFITNNNEKSLRINWSSWSNYNNRKTFNYEFILSGWGEIGKVYEVNDCEDLLQAYWKVAVQIAKENIDN